MKLSLSLVTLAAACASVMPSPFIPVAAAQPAVTSQPKQGVQAAPPITFEPATLDLGVGTPGEKLTRDCVLRNTGTTPLKVVRLKGSCSCTVPSIEKDTIGPGETVTMTVALDPGWLPIKQHKMVNVFIEGFSRPAVLQVLGEVSFAVRAEKPVQKLPLADPATSFWIESIDHTPFRVLEVNGKKTDGKGNPVTSTEASERHDIAYAFGDETIPNYLVIETDHPEGAILVVRMDHPTVMRRDAELRKGWRTERSFVNVGRLQPGETAEFEVPVSGPIDSEGLKLSSDDKRLEFKYLGKTPDDEKRGWFNVKVAMTVRDREARGMINTALHIASADTDQSVHSYVVGTVRPAERVAHE